MIFWCGITEAVQLFARAFFRMWVAGDWFLILLASDAREMVDFAALNRDGLCICAMIVIVGFILAIVSLFLSPRNWLILLGLFALYVIQGVARYGTVWTPAYLAYDTMRGIRDYSQLIHEGRWTAEDELAAKKSATTMPTNTPSVIVLVLGESLTTSRMGIYGYAKDTTPELRAWSTNGLAVLPPRRASSSYTAKALQDLLVWDGVSMVRRMRRDGYHPVIVSAQGHWSRYCGVEQMVFSACERKRYLSDELTNQFYCDLDLLRVVDEEMSSAKRPLLLIVHLLGSHFPYAERCPDYVLRPDGLDDYDMTVRITDMVVSALIRVLPSDGVLVFTSDHGESPNSGSSRNASDPDLWRVPMLVYPAQASRMVPTLIRVGE